MDITDGAGVDTEFLIGPTTAYGRALALRVLFCDASLRLWRRAGRALVMAARRGRVAAVVAAAWFHPRNAQGILAMVTLAALVLRRLAGMRARAASAARREFWRNLMRSALTYKEWAHAARMLDKEAGGAAREAELYDVELVHNKLQELRKRREEGSLRDIVFYLRADLLRNLGNMCNPELHKGRLQVPKLINLYIEEVSTQLKMVCDPNNEELPLEEKLAFMHETRHAFGRTALLLSGGASLGAFHVGVVKTLVEHKLLPRIIAGSSVGSIMCAIVATRSWPELESFFEHWQSLQFFDQMGGIFAVVKRILTRGAVHDIRHLQMHLRHLTSNMTFQEAYDMTGRILGITVCSPRKHEPPRCLNYMTSPHVLIWSAVTASCAFPGLFEAQELMAKDLFGAVVPYHAAFLSAEFAGGGGREGTRRWRDGSLESDLPMKQLKELFNVNHFIVSQANPHIAPLLRLKELIRAFCGQFAAKLAKITEMEVKNRCNQILELGFPLGGIAKLFAQEWEGDVTLVMPATLAQYSKIIQNPSHSELQKAANQGRRCTWEKLSAIKANCAIELVLDDCVALLNHMRKLRRNAERVAASSSVNASGVRLCPTQRIPSWNIIARENSSGSLDDVLTVYNASAGAGPSNRSVNSPGSLNESSDNEAENADLASWTRNGGPLMRSESAQQFINFLQRIETDQDFGALSPLDAENRSTHSAAGTRNVSVESSPQLSSGQNPFSNSAAASSLATSILVSQGDMLQPEMIDNGILLNVVRRETILASASGSSAVWSEPSLKQVDLEMVPTECPESFSTSDDDEPTAPGSSGAVRTASLTERHEGMPAPTVSCRSDQETPAEHSHTGRPGS